jgi:Glycosyltransferases, probably involved in cell wall biogenesis
MTDNERVGESELATASLPFVSIVVAARNESRSIGECLRGLLAQDYPPDRYEVLVVDGSSTDDTVDQVRAIAERDTRVSIVDNPARIAPAAFNLGIRASRGEIVGLMSAHGAPASDYLRRGVSDLSSTGAWGVGGRIGRVGVTPRQRAIGRATSSPFGVGNAVHNYGTEQRWVETAFPGLWPRWVFERVGLFDQELVRNQDDELSFRIRAAGGRILYDPAIVVAYAPRSSLRRLFSQYRQYGMWKVRVYQKQPRAIRLRQVVPPVWVAVLVGGWLLTPVTILGPAASIVAAASYGAVMGAVAVRLGEAGVPRREIFAALSAVHVGYGVGMWAGLARFAPRWVVARRGRRELLDPSPS